MNLRRLLLCGLGTGLLRPASGTWGSTPPVVLVLLLLLVMGPHWTIEAILVLVAVLFSLVCLRFGEEGEVFWKRKDPGQVVADEIAGQALVLLGLPWQPITDRASAVHDLILAAVAFLSFRFFDIVKLPPARGLQRLHGGLGILIDDLVAAVYAAIVTQVVVRFVL